MSEQLQWQPFDQVVSTFVGDHQVEMFRNSLEGSFHEKVYVSGSGQYALVLRDNSPQKKVFDLWNKKVMAFSQTHANGFRMASFSENGRFFAIGEPGTPNLERLITQDNIEVFETETGNRKAYIKDGTLIGFVPGNESRLAVHREFKYHIYDIVETTVKVSDFESPGIYRGFSTCGEWFFTGGMENENICAYNLMTQANPFITCGTYQNAVVPLSGSKVIISHAGGKKLSAVNILSGHTIWEKNYKNTTGLYYLSASPCGKFISSIHDRQIHIIDSRNGHSICSIEVGNPGPESFCPRLTAEFIATKDPSEIKLIVPGTVYPFTNCNENFGPTIITFNIPPQE